MRRNWIVLSIVALAVCALGDERLFVRTSSDGSQIEIGGSAGGPASRAIRFVVAQPEVERWPEALSVTIKNAGGTQWNVLLESRFAVKPHVLRVAEGSYELTFTAAHHQPVRRNVVLADTDADLGTLRLVRHPVLTGRVHAANGSPIVGAFVRDRAESSAKTDILGAFALEIANEWPSRIEISYPGLTTKEIVVPKAQASTKLPDVTLFKGSELIVDIEGLAEDAAIDLATEGNTAQANVVEVVRTMQVSKSAPRAVFEDLDRRTYIVVIRGGDGLKRLAVPVDVDEGAAVSKSIRIEPINVEIDVQRGSSPAANAIVTVQGEGNRWSSALRTDTDGRINAQAWQRGECVFAVQLTESSVPVLLLQEITGATTAKVHIEIPDRTITGQVVDAESGSPVASAVVYVESKNDDDTGGTLSVPAGPDGKFVIEGLRDGSHTLLVEADNYLRSEPVAVRVDQTLSRRDMSLRLSHGLSRQLRVVTPNGFPVRNAIVVATVAGSVTGVLKTDEMGRTTLRLPDGGGAVAYVLPAEGSFAISRLTSKANDGADTIMVPNGTASLELHAQDSSGKGIPHVRFVMRYDGELFPPEVTDLLLAKRGLSAITGQDGVARLDRLPPGFLELWPARGGQEASDIVAGGTAAPIQVALKDGLNVASMTFTRKH